MQSQELNSYSHENPPDWQTAVSSTQQISTKMENYFPKFPWSETKNKN